MQNDAIRNITGEGKFGGYSVPQDYGVDCISGWNLQPTGAFSSSTGVTGNTLGNRKIVFKASNVVPTANENRPYNFNSKFYVKI